MKILWNISHKTNINLKRRESIKAWHWISIVKSTNTSNISQAAADYAWRNFQIVLPLMKSCDADMCSSKSFYNPNSPKWTLKRPFHSLLSLPARNPSLVILHQRIGRRLLIGFEGSTTESLHGNAAINVICYDLNNYNILQR